MAARPYILAETNWKTVAAAKYAAAVLPWGATEAHNFHLPYGTDTMQCDAIAAAAAKAAWDSGARVIVLPTVPFGVQTGQLDIPFCLNMNPSTQAAVLRDIAVSLNAAGIQKLVILNGHGGNDFRQIVRELQPQVPIFLSVVNWYKVVDPAAYFAEPGDHAGEMETSLMQHIAAHLVLPLTQAGDGRERKFRIAAFRDGWAWAPRQWTQASADTGVGNPREATAEKGARYAAAVAEKIGQFLADLVRADVQDLYESPKD
ncbi:MAG: creatininase family protein [Planctomycetes bacterium]|nr:creatininase family protein [Planctomycetota bacterium]